jgi:hypothetical protein
MNLGSADGAKYSRPKTTVILCCVQSLRAFGAETRSCHTLSTTPGSDTDLVLLFIDHWEIDISISRK